MKKSVLLGIVLFCGLFSIKTVQAFQTTDQQLWNTESIEGGLSPGVKVKMEAEFRFGDNVSQLYYNHTDAGLAFKLSDLLSIGLNYRQIYEKKKDLLVEENRPHVNATLKGKWLGIKISDRSRLEYRILKNKDNSWRYRNKLGLDLPVKWSAMEIQPYLADEIFVDFAVSEFNRNRLYAGLKGKITEKLRTDIFYLWQSSKKNDVWNNINVIGFKLKVVF